MGKGIGGALSGLFGSENEARVKAPELDPNAYQWGGRAGGADADAARFGAQAQAAQGRQGVGVNYNQADADRNYQLQARNQQGQVADLMMQRAQGRVPSIAQMQADRQMQQTQAMAARQMQQAQSAQGAQAASARGAAGVALAQQNAANNIANAHGQIGAQAQMTASDISNQAQINAANERLAAEQGAFGAYGGMRGQDLGSQQQTAQQSQYQAGLSQQQRALNDQYSLGMTGYETGTRQAQLNAQQNQQAQRSANELGAAGINAGVAAQNAQTNQQNATGVLGLARDAAGLIGLADGGPMEANRPYLVGERGPELVVPRNNGHVIPAEQTAELIAPSTWGTGGPDVYGQAVAGMRSQLAADQVRDASRQADSYENSYARDVRQVQTLRQLNPELVNDDDDRREQRGLAMMGLQRKQSAQKESVSKEPAPSAQRTERKRDALDRMIDARPAEYRQMGGYVPPQLLGGGDFRISARATGGPVFGGAPFLGGEQGPELVMPAPVRSPPGVGGGVDIGGATGMSGGMVRAASTGLAGKPGGIRGMVGGGGITGGKSVGGFGGFREGGGPVSGGTAYAMGERGPEMVIPLYEPPGKELHQNFDGRAFFADAQTYDDGRPSLAGMSRDSAPVVARAPVKAKTAAAAKRREMTPEELLRAADEIEAKMRGEHDARMAQGPAIARMR